MAFKINKIPEPMNLGRRISFGELDSEEFNIATMVGLGELGNFDLGFINEAEKNDNVEFSLTKEAGANEIISELALDINAIPLVRKRSREVLKERRTKLKGTKRAKKKESKLAKDNKRRKIAMGRSRAKGRFVESEFEFVPITELM